MSKQKNMTGQIATLKKVMHYLKHYIPILILSVVLATVTVAQEVCGAIRACVAEIYDQATADSVRIQYGGSVNAGNAAELFAKPDIDGGLVGGASLKADFGKIVNY